MKYPEIHEAHNRLKLRDIVRHIPKKHQKGQRDDRTKEILIKRMSKKTNNMEKGE